MGDMTLDLTPRGAASIEALVNGPRCAYSALSARTVMPTMLAGLPGFELSLATAHYMSCALRT